MPANTIMIMTRRLLFAGVGLSLAIAVPATALPAHAAPTPAWRPVYQTPAGDGHGGFDDVFALGPKKAWAVGSHQSGGLIRFAQWNGTAWQPVEVPSSVYSGLRSPALHTVTASSPANVWAFGDARRGGADVGFALRWNGTSWTRKVFAAGMRISDAAFVGKQLWITGSRCTSSGCQGFIRRFDGKAWRAVPLPKVKTKGKRIGFNRLSPRPGGGVWAAGSVHSTSAPVSTPVVAYWNGKKWKTLPRPKVSLRKGLAYGFTDLAAQGSKTVWATATVLSPGEGSTYAGLLLRWNGKKWKHFRIKDKQGIAKFAPDGKKGFWLLNGSHRALLHFNGGKVDRRYAPKAGGKNGRAFGLTRIPGTRSLWAVGVAGERGTVWKYGP